MPLAVIGAGKMARAIVQGLLQNKDSTPGIITGTGRSQATREAFLALDQGGKLQWSDSIPEAVAHASVVLIAVKPAQIQALLPEIARAPHEALIISVAAGIPLKTLEAGLGLGRPIVRAMPNTPLMVGAGATAYCGNNALTTAHRRTVESLFGSNGLIIAVSETQLDAVTALSGSGPAFLALILDHLIQSAVTLGLEPGVAGPLALQTMLGTARLLQESGMTPQQLIAQVRSKGGTTEAGLNILQSGNLEALLHQTLAAAAQRSRELADA